MTTPRKRLRVPAGPVRGDRYRDAHGLEWVVLGSELAVGVDMVELEVSGGGMRRHIAASRLAEWERA